MSHSFRIIAVIAAFNEGDIISQVLAHLLDNGIDVYLIDNHSTDDTVQQAERWLGKGLMNIELFPQSSEEAGKFEWAAILRRKEELARTLQADWFIHHDADEFRESPWPNITLKEAIRWVDKLGYNCIDFRVLNFPPIDDEFRPADDPRTYFRFCEAPPEIDRVQRKAWKSTNRPVSLVASGGHDAQFQDRHVFPVRFLLRHYPIRGQKHGLKKVLEERKARLLPAEHSQGWHVQYDQVLDKSHSFIKDPRSLIPFDLDEAKLGLMLPEELLSDFAKMQGERDELKQHATNLERDRDVLRQHATNWSRDRDQLRLHASNLERDRDDLKRHAANLERECEDLRQHATNLERDRDDLKRHAANLEREHEDLRQHATNSEKDRDDLKRHASSLERERDGLIQGITALNMERHQLARQVTTLKDKLCKISSRADSLEQSRQQLENQKNALEAELAAIHNSFVWRSTFVLRQFFNRDKKSKTDESQHLVIKSDAIFSHIDIPGEMQTTVVETCLLRGWTCSPNGIESVKIFVDGDKVQEFTPDLERPDVALAYPQIPGSGRSGFDVTIYLGFLSQGIHDLQLVIRDTGGNECRHQRSLQVYGNPYHRVLLEKQLGSHEREALQASIAAMERSPRFELWVDGRVADDIMPTLRSILTQTYANYACHIVERAPGNLRSSLERYLPEGISWHTSFALGHGNDLDSGDYISFLLPGERLMPDALLHLASDLAQSQASLAYSDHDLVEPTGMHTDPCYAPDWAPEHLYAYNYVEGVFFARRDEIRKHPIALEGASWRFELLLRITETAKHIMHVPKVLWSSTPVALQSSEIAKAGLQLVEAALGRRGAVAEVTAMADAPVRRIRRRPASLSLVSIIIPTTGQPDLLRKLVESISANTSYPRYEMLFLDNGRGSHIDGIEFLRSKGLRVIDRNEPFNWARLNNAGAHACIGELLLFLNDDIEVIEPGWLEELVAQVLVTDVGTVGAMLLYPDGRIQHAGIFLVDHGGGSRHYFQLMDPKGGTYMHLDRVVREVTASTGACLMVRREVFEEMGGFDEEFPVAFNDTDFCLRLLERGYRNIWTPYCRLIHHESFSRKGTNITEDERRMWAKWGGRLLSGDAYHNPNLAKDRADCSLDTSALNRKPLAKQEPGECQGVNLIGYISAEMGVGEAARSLARSMERSGIPFSVMDYEYRNPARKGDLSLSHRIAKQPVHDINILHVNADLTPEAYDRLGSPVFEGRYTIGYWVWELPEFPDRWLSSFDYIDEVWVPSEFVREAIMHKSKVPVTRIPHSIDKGPGPYFDRPFFELPAARFLFLSMYDTQSVTERKNPEGSIKAFRDAFSPTDQAVGLVLKVNNFDEKEGEKLRALIEDHKNIYLIDRTLTRYEVDSLLACCDCFVSLHRSEGFGLPIAEAMALGKPVIATHWSGNVDFMDQTCAACVDFEIRQIGRNCGPYDAKQHWAEPSLESAARWMHALYSEPTLAHRIGAAGAKRIRESFSDAIVGELIRKRLAQIAIMRSLNSHVLSAGLRDSI
jgi:GT2 family glycosyltransferase